MIKVATSPVEITFMTDELIVSKTDRNGNITYANRTFMKVSNFSEQKILGNPHNIIRHPDMPKGVFYGLWKTLKSEREFFGFVKNITADGNYYWVFANITPDYLDGNVVGYYSVRRKASQQAVATIEPFYQQMLALEKNNKSSNVAEHSWQWLTQQLQDTMDMNYEHAVLSVYQNNQEQG
ncbi:PAS domain-containing protein [Vibrio sp. MA40-2]|uniref:PAS domain-containing protein n=1 Tax=Vibrio sp. MA40-2 TaxID=3391828 RepID=UPI0039A69973